MTRQRDQVNVTGQISNRSSGGDVPNSERGPGGFTHCRAKRTPVRIGYARPIDARGLHPLVSMSPIRTLFVCACSLAVHLDRLPSIRALPPPAQGVPLKSIAFGSCNKEGMDTDAELWESVIKSSPSVWVWMGDAICESQLCLPGLCRLGSRLYFAYVHNMPCGSTS